MNRDEKAAVIDEMASEIDAATAVFAIDYRGISVKQSADLRGRLGGADAHFRVVKNRLGIRAADQAGAEDLKAMLEGPTALTFVHGDAALAAKELAAFRREHGLLVFKGGTMDGDTLSGDDVDAISKLPSRDALYAQLVGITASPLTGLVRGLGGLISGMARQLQQLQDQGLVGGGETAAPADDGATTGPDEGGATDAGDGVSDDDGDTPEAAAGEDSGDTKTSEAAAESGDAPEETAESGDAPEDAAESGGAPEEAAEPAAEAPGDPVSEAAAAEEESAGGDESAAETETENQE